MISLRQLSKRFGSHPAADELALEVGVSETLVLLGTSGGGKTTTLKMTSGLVEPDAGSRQIGGETCWEWVRLSFETCCKKTA